jgi:hypothetical protein
LLKLIDPGLHRFPFETSWKSQNAWWNWWSRKVRKTAVQRLPWTVQALFQKASPYDHMRFIESHLNTLREICLDLPTQDGLWRLVDRGRLEFLLRPESGEARRQDGDTFFSVATLCYARRNQVA